MFMYKPIGLTMQHKTKLIAMYIKILIAMYIKFNKLFFIIYTSTDNIYL